MRLYLLVLVNKNRSLSDIGDVRCWSEMNESINIVCS